MGGAADDSRARADALLRLLDVTATRTAACTFTIWGYGIGPALIALLRAGAALQRSDLTERATELVRQGTQQAPGPTDHLIVAEAVLALNDKIPGADAAVDRFVTAVRGADRPVQGRPQVHRPDLRDWSRTIWVDCMHTDGPGLAAAGLPDAAVQAMAEYAAVLQRPDGLFDHGYDVATGSGNHVAWGRGQGWALLGLIGTLRHARDAGLLERLDRLVDALGQHEVDGRWPTVVDRPDYPIELSTSALVATAVGTAVREGLVSPSRNALAHRAFAAVIAGLDDGVLPTSDATPVGRAEDYARRLTGCHPWGQGPALAALLDSADHNLDHDLPVPEQRDEGL